MLDRNKLKYIIFLILFFFINRTESQITINDILGDYICNVNHLQTFNGSVDYVCSGAKLRFINATPSLCSNNDFTALDSGCVTTFFASPFSSHCIIHPDSSFTQCGSAPTSVCSAPVCGHYFANDSIYFKIKDGPDPSYTEFFGKKIQTPTGTSKNEILNMQLKIYPNPANDKIFISNRTLQKNTRVMLYNNVGEVIINKNNATEIDVSDIPNGIYFLKLQSETGIENKKILVQH